MKRLILLCLILLPVLQAAGQRYPYSDQIVHKDFMYDGEMVGYDFVPYRRSTPAVTWQKIPAASSEYPFTAAQYTAADNAMRGIYATLMTSPLLADLQGVGARTYAWVAPGSPNWGDHNPFPGSFPRPYIRGMIALGLNPYYRMDNGRITTFGEYWKEIHIRANDLSGLIFGGLLLPGYDFVTELKPHDDRWMGHTVFHMQGYDRIVISRKNIPLYVPATYREFMDAWFKLQEKFLAENVSSTDNGRREAEERMASYKKNIDDMEKKDMVSAAEIAKMRALFEEQRAEMKKMFDAVEPEQREYQTELRAGIAAQRQALLALPADAPAMIWDELLSPLIRPAGFGEEDRPRPVFKVNPALIDLSRPADIQFLTIEIPPYNERYDQEIGFWRNYWLVWQVMKDEATWGKIIEKVKK